MNLRMDNLYMHQSEVYQSSYKSQVSVVYISTIEFTDNHNSLLLECDTEFILFDL